MMLREIAYRAGRKAYEKGVPFEMGYLFYLGDELGLMTWRRGWLDAEAIRQIKQAENN